MTATGWILPLDPSEVRADVVQHVLDVATRASTALGLPREAELELFRPCAAGTRGAVACPPWAVDRVGFCVRPMPNVVFVFAGLPTPDHFERVVVHECRHAWQYLTDYEGSPDDMERDAIEYAVGWLGRERYAATEQENLMPDTRAHYQALLGNQLNPTFGSESEFDASGPTWGTPDNTPGWTPGWIRVLEPEEVAADVADGVAAVADAAAQALALPLEVTVGFFEPCTSDHPDATGPSAFSEVWGFAAQSRPGVIFVRAGLTPAETERTVVHEVRHVWQRVHGHHETHSHDDQERDAHTFDERWMEARS